MVFKKLDKVRTFEKLDGVANILRMMVYGVCILCVIVFGIKQYAGIITTDQFLLYTVCAMMVVRILHDGKKDQKMGGKQIKAVNNE